MRGQTGPIENFGVCAGYEGKRQAASALVAEVHSDALSCTIEWIGMDSATACGSCAFKP